MKAPCKDCAEREVGCHGKCDRYQAYRAEIDARKSGIYANADSKSYVSDIRRRIALRRMPNVRRYWKKEK